MADRTNTADVAATDGEPGVPGVDWKAEVHQRDLDSNVTALAPKGGTGTHTEANVDVLIHVLSGSGQLTTERGTIDLAPGAFVWLPRRSQRQFTAGPDGLHYLTVHQTREILPLTPTVQEVS